MTNRFSSLFGTKAFYKNLILIMVPILIQNAITNFISLLDNVMVGRIGTEQMSGVSIVNQLLFVFYLCIFGAISGAGLFGAQFFGKQDHEGVKHTFRFKLLVSAVLYALAMLLLITCGDRLISLYLHEGGETGDLELTLQYAKQYLSVSLIGLFPYTLTQVYASTLREIKHTLPPMSAGLFGVGINLTLNYLLIFGKLGFPTLGVVGAAIATVIARCCECIAVIVWTHVNRHQCEFIKGAYRSLYVPAALVRSITVTGLPLLLNETVWAAGQAMLLQCYSVRGIATVSAMNITNTVYNTFSVLFMAVGSAIAILLGHELGAGRIDEARVSARRLIAFSIGMGILCGVLVAAAAPFFPRIYNTTDEVRSLAVALTLVLALASPLHSYLHASYFTIRSGGKTLITFLFDSGYVWAVNVVLAYLLCRFTSLSLVAVYLIVHFSDLAKAVLAFFVVRSGCWATDLTKIA